MTVFHGMRGRIFFFKANSDFFFKGYLFFSKYLLEENGALHYIRVYVGSENTGMVVVTLVLWSSLFCVSCMGYNFAENVI